MIRIREMADGDSVTSHKGQTAKQVNPRYFYKTEKKIDFLLRIFVEFKCL